MYTSQTVLAEEIIATLNQAKVFSQVKLTGSLSEGRYDSMSDIDLILVGHDRPPWENVELGSRLIREKHGCLLHDWARSLIPTKYLMSHFLPGCDIMWWVDIGCYPDDRHGNIARDEIEEEWNAHIAKLLIMNAKHYLRDTESKLRIRDLYDKVVGGAPKGMGMADMFKAIRSGIEDRAFSDELVSRIDEVMQQVANKAH